MPSIYVGAGATLPDATETPSATTVGADMNTG